MKEKLIRILVEVLEALVTLSAISGGILLLTGTYRDGVLIEAGGNGQFPLEWLQATPFSGYTIPALILAVGVGGSALVALITIFANLQLGLFASAVAGLILAGYILVEVVLLKQGLSWIESMYFGLGLLIFGLAVYLWMGEHRYQSFQPR
jgi:hypothetical protein